MEQEILIRPSPKAFIIHRYLWSLVIALLLLLAGLYILFTSASPDFILPIGGSLPVIQIVLGLWSLAVIITGFAFIHTHLHQRAYLALRSEELVYEYGIINHHKITVPLHMVTDSQITRLWFDRLVGSATLQVDTSGGSGYEITAYEFGAADVERLYNELMKLINELPNSLPDDLAKDSGPAKPTGGQEKK